MKSFRLIAPLGLWLIVMGTSLVACSNYDETEAQTPKRTYSSEVYMYLNKANERENLDEEGRSGYKAKEWRMEMPDTTSVDRIFMLRFCDGKYREEYGKYYGLEDLNYVPSREGLDSLHISGSAYFSYRQFKEITRLVKEKVGDMPRYVFDLRQEAHGFVNGDHVSWYGYINWSNIGKDSAQIVQEEEELFHSLKGKTITAGYISPANNYVMTKAREITVHPDSAWTERDVAEREGWKYLRLTAVDHAFPTDKVIDEFIKLYRQLPKNVWIHFNCGAGHGRTTLWMTFFDMLRNPHVPLKDILYRQVLIGGANLYYRGTRPTEQPWRVQLFIETATLVPVLYDYAQDNAANGYAVSWSEWKKKTFAQSMATAN